MILHVFNSSVVSGPETLVVPQLPAVSEALGHPVQVALLLEKRRSEQENQRVIEFVRRQGLEPRVLQVRGRLDREVMKELSSIICREKVEVLHAHDVKASWYALAASKIARRRTAMRAPSLVSTHHGVRNRPLGRARVYAWWYEHRVLPRFDRVIAVCSSDAQLLKQRGIADESLRVLRNGVTRPRTLVAGRRDFALKLKAEFGLPPESRVLASVARLSREKGIGELLHVLRLFGAGYPDPWYCLMVGSGKDQACFMRDAQELGIDQHLRWCGYRSDAFGIMQGCDVVLSCSAAEGLPISLVEAGWAGATIAANRVDGICELLPNDDFGLPWELGQPLEEKAKSLIELVRNEKRRESLARRYQKLIQEQFSGEKWVQDLVAIYRECRPASF